jgi:hypothetical protein
MSNDKEHNEGEGQIDLHIGTQAGAKDTPHNYERDFANHDRQFPPIYFVAISGIKETESKLDAFVI